ncbi:MAG: AmmeMemoRadiSam system protein B, partial [Myxococcales bacterium]|nr:AmmeMemoRadiSam system protein B [Myxococcales bacterium]
MSRTRAPAVAGFFYPEDSAELESAVASYLAAVPAPPSSAPAPKALIVPHAGYVYSGPVAASGYARIAGQRRAIRRVVLLGPSHRVSLRGLAASGADAFLTPLGAVPLDREAIDQILDFPQMRIFDAAHRDEHSLEVQLPFLQVLLEDFSLVPLSVGDAEPEEVGEVIERLWGGPETLFVVSSDLSHYYDYETARRLDAATTRAIEALDAHGHRIDPQRIECSSCQKALKTDGFCDRCRMGFVKKQAYLSRLTYHLALGKEIAAADIACETCKDFAGKTGWCDKCRRGWIGFVSTDRKKDYDQAARAYAIVV